MDGMSVVDLSRWQFALTIMFHYLYPPLTIGLGVIMVIMEALYLKTRDHHYEQMARFWTRIFAVTFAMGVATGIVMEFQFGTNWSVYSRFVGDVFGSALAAEGIFAFFLESGFLAIVVFGWDRVSPKVHFFSTLMVSLGSIFSAVWIVVANSWQQTPAGHHIVQGPSGMRAEIVDFWAMVFNPSSVQRLSHTLTGAFILGAFFVMSISAFYILRRRHLIFAKRSFTIALLLGCVVSVGQLLLGHAHAVQVAETQPAKMAAFEGLFTSSEGGTRLSLFGIPDEKNNVMHMDIGIPKMLSFLVHFDPNKPVPGLDKFVPEDRPPVAIPFVSYHMMIGLGTFFIGITLLGVFMLWRGTLFETRWLMWVFVFSVAGPYIANQAGWVAAEVGRQPWIVYGLLRTKDAASPSIDAWEVMVSIIMFTTIYLLLFAVWIFVLNDKIQHGPDEPQDTPPQRTTGEGLLDAAAALESHDVSLTDAKDQPAPAEG